MDAKAVQVMERVTKKFPPSYVYSDDHWEDRHRYYRAFCPYSQVSFFCLESDEISHKDYIDDRYEGINDRYARVIKGDNGGIARFFVFL